MQQQAQGACSCCCCERVRSCCSYRAFATAAAAAAVTTTHAWDEDAGNCSHGSAAVHQLSLLVPAQRVGVGTQVLAARAAAGCSAGAAAVAHARQEQLLAGIVMRPPSAAATAAAAAAGLQQQQRSRDQPCVHSLSSCQPVATCAPNTAACSAHQGVEAKVAGQPAAAAAAARLQRRRSSKWSRGGEEASDLCRGSRSAGPACCCKERNPQRAARRCISRCIGAASAAQPARSPLLCASACAAFACVCCVPAARLRGRLRCELLSLLRRSSTPAGPSGLAAAASSTDIHLLRSGLPGGRRAPLTPRCRVQAMLLAAGLPSRLLLRAARPAWR